jgi:hypothetical protein
MEEGEADTPGKAGLRGRKREEETWDHFTPTGEPCWFKLSPMCVYLVLVSSYPNLGWMSVEQGLRFAHSAGPKTAKGKQAQTCKYCNKTMSTGMAEVMHRQFLLSFQSIDLAIAFTRHPQHDFFPALLPLQRSADNSKTKNVFYSYAL